MPVFEPNSAFSAPRQHEMARSVARLGTLEGVFSAPRRGSRAAAGRGGQSGTKVARVNVAKCQNHAIARRSVPFRASRRSPTRVASPVFPASGCRSPRLHRCPGLPAVPRAPSSPREGRATPHAGIRSPDVPRPSTEALGTPPVGAGSDPVPASPLTRHGPERGSLPPKPLDYWPSTRP